MGLHTRKSLVLLTVERPRDQRLSRARRRGTRRPAGGARRLKQAEYGRAAASHRRMGGAFTAQDPDNPSNLGVACGDKRLEIVGELCLCVLIRTRATLCALGAGS